VTNGWSNSIEIPSETTRLYILELVKRVCDDELENETTSGFEFLLAFENHIDNDENEDSHI